MKEAGAALPTYCVQEPEIPLLQIDKPVQVIFIRCRFALAAMYADGLQIRILNKEVDINFGSIYENAVARTLRHGFELYYFNSKKQGELDFVIEYEGYLPDRSETEKLYETSGFK